METTLIIIGIGVTIIIAVFTAWINLRVKIASLEVKILNIEKQFEHEVMDNSKEFQKMDENFKEVFKGLNKIEIAMVNKEDRK